MKSILFSIITLILLSGCTPSIGLGIGVAGVSNDGIAGTEIIADSQTGIHGSVVMGADIDL